MNCVKMIEYVVNTKINLEKEIWMENERIEFYFNYFKITQSVGF